MPKPPTEADLKKQSEALARMVERAERGDHSVLGELRRALDADAQVWRTYGDLAEHSLAALGMLAAGPNLLLAESLQRKIAEMKAELAGPSPSPLERLLAGRVVATWLQVSYYDGLAAQSAGAGEARLRAIRQQQESAERRHLAALKTLATVRKVLTPALSPLEVASRLDPGGTQPGRRESAPEAAGTARPGREPGAWPGRREGVAGRVPVDN